MSRIPRDSWDIIQKIIRRYPDQKTEYENARTEILEGTLRGDGQPGGNLPGNPTERTAMLLHTPRMDRMKREIEAVEKVYGKMSEEYQKVIRVRFWSNRFKNMPYLWMERCVSYSQKQMYRICSKFVRDVGIELGEVKR